MKEYIVLVSKEHYNPLGIVRTLGEAGIKPIVVAVKGDLKFVGQSKYVKEKLILLKKGFDSYFLSSQKIKKKNHSF